MYTKATSYKLQEEENWK